MKVVCEHCGLPFSVSRVAPGKPVYCCSGCALAARVPRDAGGGGPVDATMATALGAGFLFFNQTLFWMLGILFSRRPEAAASSNAGRMEPVSLAAGALVWMALVFLQAKAGAARAADRIFAAACVIGLASAWFGDRSGIALIFNAVFAAWTLRGLARRKFPGKK